MAEEILVQFLMLAKGAKGAACVALIREVLSSKKIFVFGELLAMPNVQAVRRCLAWLAWRWCALLLVTRVISRVLVLQR